MVTYLLDTNILLRLLTPESEEYDIIERAITRIFLQGGQCFITSQILIEFWVVVTRPLEVNGLGWTLERTREAIDRLLDQFNFLEETSEIFSHWLTLVTTYNIRGKRSHDIRLQSVALTYNLDYILTLNTQDFISIEGVNIIHPERLN
jgi:predicted nucleic-acid-binding protein